MNARKRLNLYDPITNAILCLKPLIAGSLSGFHFLTIDNMCFASLLQSFNTERKQILLDSWVFINIVMP